MFEKYIPKRYANALLKHVVAVTLFIPYYYSKSYNIYFPDFILATFFSTLCLITICTSWKPDFRRNGILAGVLSIVLLAYNVYATHMNYHYHHWYGDQINTTLAYLFFIALLLVQDSHELVDDLLIKSMIHMIVLSNIMALCYRALDKYANLLFFNKGVSMGTFPKSEKQYSWLYSFKSEYAFLLLLCIVFFIVYKKHFHNTLTYCLSQGVLLVALYLSTTQTSMVAALIIFGTQFLDYWWKTNWKMKLVSLAVIPLPLIFVAKELYQKIVDSRNILTLNSRTYIWSSFLEYIRETPGGIGVSFGSAMFPAGENLFLTNNAHNVFLNHALRFSIPVGILYTVLLLVIVLFSFIRKPSFLTLGIWIAVFIATMMDQALNTLELSFVLFLFYCIFFRTKKKCLETTNS